MSDDEPLRLTMEIPARVARDLCALAEYRGTEIGREVVRGVDLVCAGAAADPDATPVAQLTTLRNATMALIAIADRTLGALDKLDVLPDAARVPWELLGGEVEAIGEGGDARPVAVAARALLDVLTTT